MKVIHKVINILSTIYPHRKSYPHRERDKGNEDSGTKITRDIQKRAE